MTDVGNTRTCATNLISQFARYYFYSHLRVPSRTVEPCVHYEIFQTEEEDITLPQNTSEIEVMSQYFFEHKKIPTINQVDKHLKKKY